MIYFKAPKKKSKGSKGGRTSAGIVDGVSMAEMSREQLEGFAARMKKELEREREERNFFQLERDKVLTFWEITRHELEENRASLRQVKNSKIIIKHKLSIMFCL